MDTVPGDNVLDENPAKHDRSPGRRNPGAINFVFYNHWKVFITSRAHALALLDVPGSVSREHPIGFMFSDDWHAAYEGDPMVGDEPEEVKEATAPATAMVDDADGAEPQGVPPDGWNLSTDAKASLSTVSSVPIDAQVTACCANLHFLRV